MSTLPFYDLAHCSLQDMTGCSASLRALGDGAQSMVAVAEQATRLLYHSLRDAQEHRACALVRFFKTHPYGALPPELQAVAQSVFAGEPTSPDVKCMTLMASAGERPEWNATEQSRHHRVIPLVADSFSVRFPMFSQLFRELGVLLPLKSSSTSDAVIGRTGQHDDVFYISDALGSSLVPDQQDFVIPYGIRSVLVFGGVLPSGDAFVMVLFSKVRIQGHTADLFKPLTLSLKLALLPFDGDAVFDTARETEKIAPVRRASERAAHCHRNAHIALEELLTVQEQTVAASMARRRRVEEALVDTRPS